MATVEPIRDAALVRQLEDDLAELTDPRGQRLYMMLMMGVYLGLRISDLLRIRVKDLRGQDVLVMREQKTGKTTQLPIPNRLKSICRKRLAGLPAEALVLQSRQRGPEGEPRAITRKTAYNDIQAMGRLMRVSYPVGCHSLRKTFGYHYYRQTKDIGFLMLWFNHSSVDITKRYIGIDLDERAQRIKGFVIK